MAITFDKEAREATGRENDDETERLDDWRLFERADEPRLLPWRPCFDFERLDDLKEPEPIKPSLDTAKLRKASAQSLLIHKSVWDLLPYSPIRHCPTVFGRLAI